MKTDATIDKSVVDRILRETNPVAIIGVYTELTPYGNIYTGHCPLCNTPKSRFVVQPKLHKWHCFNCGKHGNIFDFLVEKEFFTFDEAVKYVSVKLFDHDSDFATLHHTALPQASEQLQTLEAQGGDPKVRVPEPPSQSPVYNPEVVEFASTLAALLKTVVGYKYTVILSNDFNVLADNVPDSLDPPLLPVEFCQKIVPLLDKASETISAYFGSSERHLIIRGESGIALIDTTVYRSNTIHILCLFDLDANLVLAKRYISATVSA